MCVLFCFCLLQRPFSRLKVFVVPAAEMYFKLDGHVGVEVFVVIGRHHQYTPGVEVSLPSLASIGLPYMPTLSIRCGRPCNGFPGHAGPCGMDATTQTDEIFMEFGFFPDDLSEYVFAEDGAGPSMIAGPSEPLHLAAAPLNLAVGLDESDAGAGPSGNSSSTTEEFPLVSVKEEYIDSDEITETGSA